MLYTFGDRTYSFRAAVALTNVSGDPREIRCGSSRARDTFSGPIAATGRVASCRIGTIPRRRRCAAPAGTCGSAKDAGDWFGEAAVNARTPGFETNDFAFQQRADYIWYIANIARFWSKPTSWYRGLQRARRRPVAEQLRGRSDLAAVAPVRLRDDAAVLERVGCFISIAAVMDDGMLRGGPVVESAEQSLR